jgi:hypothetical protein
MIKKFLSDAILSMVMDKQAKDNYRHIREHKKATRADAVDHVQPLSAPSATEPALEPALEPTPDRAELIRNALAVHRDKTGILEDLSVNDRQKLFTLAEKALLGGKRG